jgi:hypothetical protein
VSEYDYGRKRTLAEAEQRVHSYVSPRECFVVFVNSKFGWQAYSETGDTPCAHYVSHEVGLTQKKGVRCRKDYLCRVKDVVARLGDPIAVADVKEGDVWARLKGESGAGGDTEPSSHCGMVLKVERGAGKPVTITIRHNSSKQRKLTEDDWAGYFKSGGKFYRRPK